MSIGYAKEFESQEISAVFFPLFHSCISEVHALFCSVKVSFKPAFLAQPGKDFRMNR